MLVCITYNFPIEAGVYEITNIKINLKVDVLHVANNSKQFNRSSIHILNTYCFILDKTTNVSRKRGHSMNNYIASIIQQPKMVNLR